MKVKLYPTHSNAVEVEAIIFTTAEAVDRFIKALETAKQIVWGSLEPESVEE
jgi:hypothetical protein